MITGAVGSGGFNGCIGDLWQPETDRKVQRLLGWKAWRISVEVVDANA